MKSSTERLLFDVPENIAYFNSANIGPRLYSVTDAGNRALEKFSRPWEIKPADWFQEPEKLRTLFSKFINVNSDQVALIPSASYGVAIAAKNIHLQHGSNIVVVEEQYPSNIYAWRRKAEENHSQIITACRSDQLSLTDSLLQSINNKTAIVAIPNCHWTDGEVIDLNLISMACKNVGSKLVIDASQSLGVRPIDFESVKPDFVVSVGYKWILGPYGLGYLYAAKEWCSEGVPLEESWLTRKGSEDFSNLVNYVDDYRVGARRFDFGEFPQFVSVPMAVAALTQLNLWSEKNIVSKISNNIENIRSICEEKGFKILSKDRSSQHIVGIRFDSGNILNTLNDILVKENIIVSRRGFILRIAPHMHTSEYDIDRLCEALMAV